MNTVIWHIDLQKQKDKMTLIAAAMWWWLFNVVNPTSYSLQLVHQLGIQPHTTKGGYHVAKVFNPTPQDAWNQTDVICVKLV
jgi:hypothetical protein